jgi:hypothetical protein
MPRLESNHPFAVLPVPLRSSHVLQRTCVPFTRTYSVHNFEEMAHQMDTSTSLDASGPPPYQSHDDDVLDSKALQLGDPSIDEISPDEDDRVVEEALRSQYIKIFLHLLTYFSDSNSFNRLLKFSSTD